MNEKFAGTNLAKARMIVEACIGWHWAEEAYAQDWERPLASTGSLPLGASPINPPPQAECAWLAKALRRSGESYVLKQWEIIVLSKGPVAIAHICGFDLATRRTEMARAVESLEAAAVKHALERFNPAPLPQFQMMDEVQTMPLAMPRWNVTGVKGHRVIPPTV